MHLFECTGKEGGGGGQDGPKIEQEQAINSEHSKLLSPQVVTEGVLVRILNSNRTLEGEDWRRIRVEPLCIAKPPWQVLVAFSSTSFTSDRWIPI